MKFRLLIFLILSVFCFCCSYSQTNDSVFTASALSSFRLYNVELQKDFTLPLSGSSLTVFIFLSPDCPFCKNYSSTLTSLQQQFKTSVVFYGIIPGKSYSTKEVQDFQSAYRILFPLLIDKEKKVSNYLQASVTPEVILLDNRQRVLYRGAIDNWAVGWGKQRRKATQSYLQNAIEQSLQHQPVAIKRTQPVGCRINDF